MNDHPASTPDALPQRPHQYGQPHASQPEESSSRPLVARVERIGIAAPTLLLWIATLGLVYAFLGTNVLRGNRGLVNVTESFGALERVALWQRALQWLPGSTGDGGFFTLPQGAIAYGVRIALALMFLVHAWSFWLAWRDGDRPFWHWLIGPIGAHLILLLMVPSNADVFFYEISGDLAANGINPYIHPLIEFPDHPIYPYNHWVNMSVVYGPLWTSINAGLMRITGPDPVTATLFYKVVLGAAAIACAIVTYRLSAYLTANRTLAVAAGVLVAWQPNMLIESSGQAHNDPVMILLATCGLALVLVGGAGAIRGAVVLVATSSMIKYVTLPLIGILAILRLTTRKTAGGMPRLFGHWALDAIAIGAVTVTTFAPYWSGPATLAEMFSEPGRLFTHPLWFIPSILLEHLLGSRVALVYEVSMRVALMLVILTVLARLMYRFGRAMWLLDSETGQGRPSDGPRPNLYPWTRPLLVAWTGIICALAFIPANSHPWYWTWPVVPIALLVTFDVAELARKPAPPRWFWVYLAATMLLTLVYHTRIVNT
ncbi:MAG: hypothetical protein M3440_05575 [Chloroflexota bacterium]|nr:hypothetical protein [Chloroflexota bacterium]